ncbi:hypothetical protein V1511DRAFT_487090 [Dipodascopsis uninucleata]
MDAAMLHEHSDLKDEVISKAPHGLVDNRDSNLIEILNQLITTAAANDDTSIKPELSNYNIEESEYSARIQQCEESMLLAKGIDRVNVARILAKTHLDLIRSGLTPKNTREMHSILKMAQLSKDTTLLINTFNEIGPRLVGAHVNNDNGRKAGKIVWSDESSELLAKIIKDDQSLGDRNKSFLYWTSFLPNPKREYLTDTFWATLMKSDKLHNSKSDNFFPQQQVERYMRELNCQRGTSFFEVTLLKLYTFDKVVHQFKYILNSLRVSPTPVMLTHLFQHAYKELSNNQADDFLKSLAELIADSNTADFVSAGIVKGLSDRKDYQSVASVRNVMEQHRKGYSETWNAILQSSMMNTDLNSIISIMRRMDASKIILNYESVKKINLLLAYNMKDSRSNKYLEVKDRWIPRRRNPFHNIKESYYILLFIAMFGNGECRLNPEAWSVLLMIMVRTRSCREVECLTDWLIKNYDPRVVDAPKAQKSIEYILMDPEDPSYPLRRLIDEDLIRYAIIQGFKRYSKKPWRIVMLLSRWSNAGVHIPHESIRLFLVQELSKSFGENPNLGSIMVNCLKVWDNKLTIENDLRLYELEGKRGEPTTKTFLRKYTT